MLRIIGGEFKSRLIKTPKSDTRPTTSMVRKAFFDICQNEIVDSLFLDLFAGSGAMGIEALSRGAAHTTFVEVHRQAIQCIKDNLELLGLQDRATLIAKEAATALKLLAKSKAVFDLIYIDPPYNQDSFSILQFIDEQPILKKGGALFLEEKAPSKLQNKRELFKHLGWIDERKFGTTVLNQFRV